MGKALPESRAEIAYAGRVLPVVSPRKPPVSTGRYNGQHDRETGRILTIAPARGAPACFVTPWKLPHGRWAPARSLQPWRPAARWSSRAGPSRRPLSMLALRPPDPRAGGALPGRRPQRDHHEALPAPSIEPLLKDPRTAQACRSRAPRRWGRRLIEQSAEADPARVDGAWRQRALSSSSTTPTLDAAVEGGVIAKMAQRRRGLHGRQPLPRARVGGRRVRAAASRGAWGAMKIGRGTDPDVDVGPLIDENQRGEGGRPGRRLGVARGARTLIGGKTAGRARLLLRAERPSWTCPRTRAACCARRSSDRSPRSRPFSSEEQALEAGQPHGVRARLLRLHGADPVPRGSASARESNRAWSALQPGSRLQPRRAVRRRQALRLRPRGRLRGDRRVPRDQVRGAGGLTGSKGATRSRTLAGLEAGGSVGWRAAGRRR